MATKKSPKPIGVAHNPQVGTIVVFDNGQTLALKLDKDTHEPLGWVDLPGFDVTPDEDLAE